ncbi:GNAT family N-acetyltransferase [Actinomyces culturomici]|uniref:GNAT family N-acetyltransferase n=1 Tax=Actinomyces culturomici TaxID=1926276 RepID=UPI0038B360E9
MGYAGCWLKDGAFWNLGYRLSPELQGRGYALEASRAAIAAAREVAPRGPDRRLPPRPQPRLEGGRRKARPHAHRLRAGRGQSRPSGRSSGVRGPPGRRGPHRDHHGVGPADPDRWAGVGALHQDAAASSSIENPRPRPRPRAPLPYFFR